MCMREHIIDTEYDLDQVHTLSYLYIILSPDHSHYSEIIIQLYCVCLVCTYITGLWTRNRACGNMLLITHLM